jgi:hypothetical protein
MGLAADSLGARCDRGNPGKMCRQMEEPSKSCDGVGEERTAITSMGYPGMVRELLRQIAATFLFPCYALRRAVRARQPIVGAFSDLVQGVFVIRLEPVRNSYQIR